MRTEERTGLEKGGPTTGTERVIGRVKIGMKDLDLKKGMSAVITMMITVGNMTIGIREKMTEDGMKRIAGEWIKMTIEEVDMMSVTEPGSRKEESIEEIQTSQERRKSRKQSRRRDSSSSDSSD